MSAFENVELPMIIHGTRSKKDCKKRAIKLLTGTYVLKLVIIGRLNYTPKKGLFFWGGGGGRGVQKNYCFFFWRARKFSPPARRRSHAKKPPIVFPCGALDKESTQACKKKNNQAHVL